MNSKRLTTLTTEVTAEAPNRIGGIVQALTQLSHSKSRGLFDHGCVQLNGKACSDHSQKVKPGDKVEVRYDPTQGYPEKKKPWEDRSFEIVFEDSCLLVVNKAAQVLTVATERDELNTLENRITKYLRSTGHKQKAFVVHRLDRGVSGLLVFAKTPRVLASLQEQFQDRKPQRIYTAIVFGHPRPREGTFRSYLTTGKNLDQYSTRQPGEGELAITHYKVVKTLADTAVVEVRLETGRRNQIRVHFADHGHPVLGDLRYNRRKGQHSAWPKGRLALHATTLGFVHPLTKQPVEFHAPLPNVMTRFISK
jgi:23S rRNA pseudouridine1911/1915/1917 synthase